jgi:hypothetical protein
VEEGEGEPLRLRLEDDHGDTAGFHRWFAVRGASAARAAVAFTTSPDWLSDPGKLALMTDGDDAAIASAIVQGRFGRRPDNVDSHNEYQGERLLDLCAGVGTVGAMAARLGFDALSVELSIVPHLIDRVLHDFAVSLAKGSSSVTSADEDRIDSWRGFVTEVEDFANAVWRGAKQRLKELFEDDVDFRLWLRLVPCPSCRRKVPVLSNVRLSRDTALNVTPDQGLGSESEFPRFGLLRTDFPDRKGTFSRGVCTCPACRYRFRFRGYDLIPLASVPVAVRMRDSSGLAEVDSPGAYITEVNAAACRSIADSLRSLGSRTVLADEQSIFHDARGGLISVHYALLPRQRAYFVALAESMQRESALLAGRAALADEHRLAVRSAVALLISGQIDYVNTFAHWLADKPHPSTFAGPLRIAGLFTEAGGYWLERSWQSRLRHLLRLLRENSSSARPVRVIQADAAAVPLGDSAVSAVVWDPPYYDNVDYDAVGEPYQAILAAMVPDLVSELVVAPKLPLRERTERYERDLQRQACEARRVVSPDGGIGVFWLAREPVELQRFLEIIAPAGLQLLRAVRLAPIRTPRVAADTGTQTYLLVLQPIPAAASAVVVDAEKVLALATVGALSLYDGLAELLESVWDPVELDGMIPGEFRGSSRQRLAGFLASHPEPEQLLVELGRMTLVRELVNRGARADELRAIDARGLAQRLLAQLGFAVARPVRFSIRAALHECEIVERRLELADSLEAVRGAFLTGCSLIERILRYASLAWAHLAYGNQWNDAFDQIIGPGMPGRSYSGPDQLTFGQYELVFAKLPAALADSGYSFGNALFARIARVIKKSKIHEKLSALVALRNGVEHDKESTAPLSLAQLRQKCSTVFAGACAVLAEIDSRQLLPLTVRPEEERRDRYGRRILRLLDPDGVAIEAYVGSETDLTEPLIYFASDSSRRDVDPKFLRAAIVEELLGLT